MGRAFEVGTPFIGWRAYEDNIGGNSGDCRSVAVCIVLDGRGGGGGRRRDGYTSNLRYSGRGLRVREGTVNVWFCLVHPDVPPLGPRLSQYLRQTTHVSELEKSPP